MQEFRNLMVWQRARSFSVALHEATRYINGTDAPGLRTQLRKAALSIAATIAEGAGRDTRKDFARFLSMAIGSANEVEQHLVQAEDLAVMDRNATQGLIGQVTEIRRMLYGLRRALLEAGGR
jgi:four helix bundle protein